MNTVKKAFALILTLAIVMSLGITAFAAGGDTPFTIKITNPANNGVTMENGHFVAYKIFNATYNVPNTAPNGDKASVTYVVTPEFATFEYDVSGTEFAGKFPNDKVTGDALPELVALMGADSVELNKFARAALVYAKSHTTDADKVEVTANSSATYVKNTNGSEIVTMDVTASGAGYYVIDCLDFNDSTKLGAVSLTTARPNADIILKFGQPTLDKKVSNAVATSEENIYSAELGKELVFTLETVVPNMAGHKTFFYQFVDERSSGVDKLAGNPVITIHGRNGSGAVLETPKATIKKGFTTTEKFNGPETGTTTMKITFADLKDTIATFYGDAGIESGDVMRVSYTGKLNGNALKTEFETNTAYLVFSADPTISVDPAAPDEGTHKTQPDTVKLTSVTLDTLKNGDIMNENNQLVNTKLAGAKFMLYKVVEEVTAGGSKISKLYYTFNSDTNKVEWKAAADATAFETDENGRLKTKFAGLEAGTYYLTETKAPQGFALPKYEIKVVIEPVISHNAFGGFSVRYGKTTETADKMLAAVSAVENGAHVLKLNIKNTAGEILPETGGIGTTIFYTVGGLLMVSALVLLITKKKMSAN